jgi:hypothetical protein
VLGSSILFIVPGALLLAGLTCAAPPTREAWLSLHRGSEALFPGGRVCNSTAALESAMLGKSTGNCTTWKGGTKVTIQSWSKASLPRAYISFDAARIRRRDGAVGIVPVPGLVPIVPAGTFVLIRKACTAVRVPDKTARVVSQRILDGEPQFVIQEPSGARRTVSSYDVTDMKGRAIAYFAQPDFPTGSPQCP